MKTLGVYLALAGVLALSACSASIAPTPSAQSVGECAGVAVVVDYGPGGPERQTLCAQDGGGLAGEVVASVGLATEGTAAYGDLVLCRVNNYPPADGPIQVAGEDPYTETCQEMPPAFAYWALWIKRAGASEWSYAEEGVGTLEVSPGDALGFVFSTGGDTPTPDSAP